VPNYLHQCPDLGLPTAIHPGEAITLHLEQYPSTTSWNLTLVQVLEGCCDPESCIVAAWQGVEATQTTQTTQTTVVIPEHLAPSLYTAIFSRRYEWRWQTDRGKHRFDVAVGNNAPQNPYHRLGLRHNPFVLGDLLLPNELWLDRVGIDTAITTNYWEVVGDKGHGKTSLLLRLQHHNPGPYHHVHPDWRSRLAALPVVAGGWVYWDELDRVPVPWLLYWLAQAKRQSCTVVVGSHKKLAMWARILGLTTKTYDLKYIHTEEILNWASRHLDFAQIDKKLSYFVIDNATIESIQQQNLIKDPHSLREWLFILHKYVWRCTQISNT
jgi:hypothetical protein